MARRVIHTFTEQGETWQLVHTVLGYLIEGPLQRFVILTPAAAKAIGAAMVAETQDEQSA